MDAFGTDLHLLLNLRVLMCLMFCGSSVVMIATLGQQNWGVMSSLKMVFACARNLIVHRFKMVSIVFALFCICFIYHIVLSV